MGARGVNFHHEVFARMGYEAQAREIQDLYLAGDKKGAIAAVPTKLVEDVALIGPWAKIADEIQRWQRDRPDHLHGQHGPAPPRPGRRPPARLGPRRSGAAGRSRRPGRTRCCLAAVK